MKPTPNELAKEKLVKKAISERWVLILLGPTGIGKTQLSLAIANLLPVEIISADSRQIYRYMDIGTDKPTPVQRQKVPHHMIDFIDPDVTYSAGAFCHDARRITEEIFQRRRIPLVVGGSGLYIRAYTKGFFGTDYKDEKLRQELMEKAHREGEMSLYRELQQVDPEAAKKIHPHNLKRVVRALEVYYLAGKPITQIQATEKEPAPFRWVKIGLNMDRKQLYERINKRVEEMFAKGFIEEVRGLLQMGYSPQLNALNSVGYKEIIAFLEEKIDLHTCVELVKRNTRRYAKRQLTWFRAEKDIHWIQLQEPIDFPGLAQEIVSLFFKKISQATPTPVTNGDHSA